MEQLYKFTEAAKKLNISVQTLRKLIKQGKIKMLNMGYNTKRLTETQLDDYIKSL